jgi:hypothetical protein
VPLSLTFNPEVSEVEVYLASQITSGNYSADEYFANSVGPVNVNQRYDGPGEPNFRITSPGQPIRMVVIRGLTGTGPAGQPVALSKVVVTPVGS